MASTTATSLQQFGVCLYCTVLTSQMASAASTKSSEHCYSQGYTIAKVRLCLVVLSSRTLAFACAPSFV